MRAATLVVAILAPALCAGGGAGTLRTGASLVLSATRPSTMSPKWMASPWFGPESFWVVVRQSLTLSAASSRFPASKYACARSGRTYERGDAPPGPVVARPYLGL